MIIGITGYKRSGKDTAAQILVDNNTFKVERIALADVMKNFTSELLGIEVEVVETLKTMGDVKLTTWGSSQTTMRTFLQSLGEGVKEVTGDELVWCRHLARQLTFGGTGGYVISDIRFPFEERFFRELAEIAGVPFVMMRVVRDGVGGDDNHVSEQSIGSVREDVTILNNGTIEELEEQLFATLSEYANKVWHNG